MRPLLSLFSTFLLFFYVFATQIAVAQEAPQTNKARFTDKIFFGGGLGLQFGSITVIDVSPVVGYRVTEKFETGLGFTYKYYNYKDYFFDNNTGIGYDLKSNILGGSVFARYHILENVFLHAEFESLRYKYDDYYTIGPLLYKEQQIANINSVFVGAGYRQRISQGSYFFIMALWNLTEDAMSPYTNPVLRMGVVFGR